MERHLKIISWNVNGLRALERERKKKANAPLFPFDGEIICLQETKINEQKDLVDIEGYQSYYSLTTRRKKIGYSGVATLVKSSHHEIKVIRVIRDEELVGRKLGGEGRILVTFHENNLIVANVYFVNHRPENGQFRQEFFHAVMEACLKLKTDSSRLILCGDFNVVYDPIDHCLYSEASSNFFSDDPLRIVFKKYVEDNSWTDLFRKFHPDRKEAYTCWNTKLGTRESNYGTRIDYILTNSLVQATAAQIMPEFTGSDHCPVMAAFSLPIELDENNCLDNNSRQKSTILKFLSATEKRQEILPTNQPAYKIKQKSNTKITTFFEKESARDIITSPLIIEPPSNTCNNHTWDQIFQPQREAPHCRGHGEPCKLRQVQKKGPNQKRFFYVCARPIGSDHHQNACNHFEWAVRSKSKSN